MFAVGAKREAEEVGLMSGVRERASGKSFNWLVARSRIVIDWCAWVCCVP